MLFLFILLPFLIFYVMRVALIDPREPNDEYSKLGMTITIVLGVLPTLLFWAPASALFNASLVLALSAVMTPIAFSSMKTDTAGEWVKDKLFLVAIRTIVAAALVGVLTYLGSGWFLAVAGFAVFLFLSRLGLWVAASGDPGRYWRALFGSAILMAIYYVMVDASQLTPKTWMDWKIHLEPFFVTSPS
ncbi:hypothetical protein [Acidovorax sp. sic0104]|uniref:hypothetical protein n=1 Tax=Acidovorax sp. sic0104 TaxID=2854784 RepID=UPI001C4762CA|nr:hypothetical protein [Acidovorax sp. sic0104]MBV7541981.1 hypothetical protein [Acidovorax sp. sic0104]